LAATTTGAAQRLDRWLWFARIVKSRTLAAQLVQDGKVRVNRAKADKPAQTVRPNDVLTIVMRGNVQVLRVVAPGARRGPAPEARLLYEVLGPVPIGSQGSEVAREQAFGSGAASKRDRRPAGRFRDHK
jgi:ribosome-associated heat shock protein Hsp15